MTDLSLVPWEEIQAELRRRFPAIAVAFVFSADGGGVRYQTRFLLYGDPTTVVGLANVLRMQAELGFVRSAQDLGPGDPPLDIS